MLQLILKINKVRDVIWTVIILWVVWKIYDAFKLVAKPNQSQSGKSYNNQGSANKTKEGEVKVDKMSENQKTHFKPSDGEYVDYEDVT